MSAFLAWLECLAPRGVRMSEGFATAAAAHRAYVESAIAKAHAAGIKVGICGQAPSNCPEVAGFLVEVGTDSIPLHPDGVVAATRHVAQTGERLAAAAAKAA